MDSLEIDSGGRRVRVPLDYEAIMPEIERFQGVETIAAVYVEGQPAPIKRLTEDQLRALIPRTFDPKKCGFAECYCDGETDKAPAACVRARAIFCLIKAHRSDPRFPNRKSPLFWILFIVTGIAAVWLYANYLDQRERTRLLEEQLQSIQKSKLKIDNQNPLPSRKTIKKPRKTAGYIDTYIHRSRGEGRS